MRLSSGLGGDYLARASFANGLWLGSGDDKEENVLLGGRLGRIDSLVLMATSSSVTELTVSRHLLRWRRLLAARTK